ncbi:GGDEF domain-containing protein [Pseudidiomarina insulisalsae]|uniref:diguanylate cyclase n=1 Tax=Pseudidiomarina insulisalsae TaxID=575789 RepID=A0A432YQL1_9GAMM|nr:GGDEF domain-containing protein [Pseudidiomarina insulisalsae]RUO63637.1 GGDEF domain-containing protein [Pseudidiomarina insulisalsae]
MTNSSTERRDEPRKKLTTRLLWHVVGVSLVLLLVTIATTFWQAYPQAKQRVIAQLQEEVEDKLRANQMHLSEIETQGELLAQEFLARYKTFADDPRFVAYFDAWFEQTSPGVLRLKESFFTGTQYDQHFFRGMSVFVGPRPAPLTDELKARIVISTMVLNDMGPAWRSEVTNSHFSLPENVLALYSLDQPWGRQAAKDLIITNFSTVKSTLQKDNPARTPNWTGLYHDHSADLWTITYQRPLDYNGQHLVNASFDVSLEALTDDLSKTTVAGVESYVLNERGALIASSTLGNGLSAEANTLTPENYADPLYQKIAARLLQAPESVTQQVWDEIDDDYLVLVQKLQTPEWWYFSVYPKALIADQALYLPLVIAVMGCLLVAVVLFVVFYFVNREVSRPLTQLASMAALMNEKNYAAIAKQSAIEMRSYGEVRQVLNAFRIMAARFTQANEELEQRIEERTRDLQVANRKLDELAHLDGLTGLLNRRAFQKDVESALKETDERCYFVLADIDDFKLFNDNYGHEAGDQALIALSQLFNQVSQAHAYRYGGEEFVMLIRAEQLAEVEQRLQKLQRAITALAIEHRFSSKGSLEVLTVSFGCTGIRADDTLSTLIQRADKSLYQAKQQGGNQIVIAD